jgi:hypothetical protein
MKVKLELPLARLEELATLCNGRGAKCHVSKRQLSRLIVDQTRLINACRGAGVEIQENEE